MPWDDHDSDFFDGFTDGLIFSNMGCGWYIIIVLSVAAILYAC